MTYPQFSLLSRLFILLSISLPVGLPLHAAEADTECPSQPVYLAETTVEIENSLRFSELFPNPIGADGDGEFIEIRNIGTTPVSLTGLRILDDRAREFTLPDLSLDAGAYLALPYAQTGLPLVNSGETISLVTDASEIIDSVTYDTSSPEGSSFAINLNGDWQWTPTPTPGTANSFPSPDNDQYTPEQLPPDLPKNDENVPDVGMLVLNEFLPDPIGSDENEWVELRNLGETPLTISGWFLDDTDGGSTPYRFPVDTVVPANGLLLVGRTESRLALNNAGDDVRLLRSDGSVHDLVTYGAAPEGQSYARSSDAWSWAEPTPGLPNEEPTPSDDLPESDEDVGEIDLPENESRISTISELDAMDDGTTVTITGAVTFAPGDIGKTLIGLQDSSGAIIIRTYGELDDHIVIGSLLSIRGKLSRMKEVARINARASDIQILGNDVLAVTTKSVADITRDDEGARVRVVGNITDVRKTWFMMTDDGARTELRVLNDHDWPIAHLIPERSVEIVGTIKYSGTDAILIPSVQSDIVVGENESVASANETESDNVTNNENESFSQIIDADDDDDTALLGHAASIVGVSLVGASSVAIRNRRRATTCD